MTLKKLTLGFATLALGVAGAASYSFTVTDPVWVGNTQLKPGEYKVEMQGGQAIFKSGKQAVEVPAVQEKADKKFPYTSFESVDSKIREIHLGGTSTTIKLNTPESAAKPVGSGS